MAQAPLVIRPIGHVMASVVSFGDLSQFDGPTDGSVSGAVPLGQRNPLGARVIDDYGFEYIYLKGATSLAQGDWVQYCIASASSPFVAVRLSTSASFGVCAVSMSAAAAATAFGWFQIWGVTPGPLAPWPSTYTAIAAIASAVTDGQALAAGSATGRVQAGPVTTKNIFGAVAIGNAGTNVGQAYLQHPYEFGSATI